MNSRTTTRAVVLVGALFSLLVGRFAAVAPPAAAAEGEVTVTWPEIMAFNPDVYDYVVEIEYDGPGVLMIGPAWQGPMVRVEPGEYRPPLSTWTNGGKQLELQLCEPEWQCTPVAFSPGFLTYRSVDSAVAFSEHHGPTTQVFSGWGASNPISVDLDWQVVPYEPDVLEPGPAVLAGSESGAHGGPVLGANDVLVHGRRYEFFADITFLGSEWGGMSGTVSTTIRWDAEPPLGELATEIEPNVVTGDRRVSRVFYPAADDYGAYGGYGDTLWIELEFDEPTIVDQIEVVDAAGERAAMPKPLNRNGRAIKWSAQWHGRRQGGALQPEGAYRIVASFRDFAGNAGTIETVAELSHARKKVVKFQRTYPAAKTVLNEWVGSCARLKRPARPGWPGSVAYMSDDECGRRSETSAVTSNGVRVPHSRFNRYFNTRVTVNGGKSRGERRSYLVLYYWAGYEKWIDRTVLGDKLGSHHGPWGLAKHTVLGSGSDRSIVWSVGLAEGAKYDVESFTVTMTYLDLR